MMCTRKVNNKIAVIGGGAAGMFASCIAAEKGASVTLFERNTLLGKKLGITGKGRCNLTNACETADFFANVPNGAKFLYSAVYSFTPSDTMAYFEKIGVPLKIERGNRVFPASDKATDVVLALKNHLKKLGVKIITERITALSCKNGELSGVISNGKEEHFDAVILATGGKSYPLTGSTGDGYAIAEKLGHNIIAPKPSLVPLETAEDTAKQMQGLSLKNVLLKVYDCEKKKYIYEDFGEMLFTHFGVSGPIVLSASSHMKYITDGRYSIHIDLKPALSEKELDKRILSDFDKYKNKDFINSLGDLLPLKMIPVFAKLTGIPEREKVNSIDKTQRAAIVRLMKDFPLTVKKARPIEEAIITSGGIDLKQINSATMESKLVKNLYFAGEIIDVDAYTGGFNLQTAFSTAFLAASSASDKGDT